MKKDVALKKKEAEQELLQKIITDREDESQELGWLFRPLCICPLPAQPLPKLEVKRGKKALEEYDTYWMRKAGKFQFEILAHKDYGVPYGQDILIILYLAYEAKMQNSRIIRVNFYRDFMRMFRLNANDGHKYKLVQDSIYRIRNSMFTWRDISNPNTRDKGGAFLYIDDYDLYFDPKTPDQLSLFDQYIKLSERFWEEINNFEIPFNLDAVRYLKQKPAHLNFYIWLSFRVWYAYRREQGRAAIPYWGENGLQQQMSSRITQRRYYRREVKNYLKSVKEVWPECPAEIDGDMLKISITTANQLDVREKAQQRLLNFSPPELPLRAERPPTDQPTPPPPTPTGRGGKEKVTTTKKKSPFEDELNKYNVKGAGLKKVLALPEEQIKRNLEYAKGYIERMAKAGTPVPNIGGLVYSAIIEDYAQKSPHEEGQEQKKKAVQDEREKRNAEHEEIRGLQKKFAAARWRKVEQRLNDLPAAEREKMDTNIEAFFLQGEYADQYKKKKFKDPMIRSLFFTAFAEDLNLTAEDIDFKKHMAAIGQPVTEDRDGWKFERRGA